MSDRPLLNLANPTDVLLMTERGGAFGLQGFIHSPRRRIVSVALRLVQGDLRLQATHQSVQDRLIDPRISSALEPTGAAGIDGGFFISAMFPFHRDIRAGLGTIEAAFTWDNGCVDELRLCFPRIELVRPAPLPEACRGQGPLVGIAMATYNPEPTLFVRQLESLLAQTHRNWVCVISDDMSNAQWLTHIRDSVANDPRFLVVRGDSRLGFYRNFERAMASLPAECRFFALSDQDDIWKTDRLEAGLAAFADATVDCVFSDMEVVTSAGRQLSPSFWVHRHESYGSISGLLLANVATGMTMLARGTILSAAVPFPATPNLTYHDAWIALLAEARGSLRYLPRPLVEYVQHGSNQIGALKAPERATAILKHSLLRLTRILRIPLSKTKDAGQIQGLLLDMNYWGGTEAAKMRILADALAWRTPRFGEFTANRRLLSMCRKFGVVQLLRAGIDWHDRHRRCVGMALVLDGLTQRIVLSYVGWSRQRAS